jgi:endonuclease YncB( thermonuclease family)
MRRLLLSIAAVAALAGLPSPAVATHGTDLDCPDFPDQAAAQAHMDAHPGDPDGLDGDGDGSACETLPCPCAAAAAPTPPPPPASASASPVAARKATARVVRVIDGDTLEVRLATAQTVSVRLIGIDTPETVKPGTRVQCGGRDATARMKKLALRDGAGRTVTLKGDPAQGLVDRFGRLLAYVSAGGVDFGRTMISSGWAKVLVVGQGFERAPSYRRAQALAKAPRRGVWRTCGGHFHRPR